MIPLDDEDSPGGIPFWTITLIILNVIVFFLEMTAVDPDGFISRYALIPAQVSLGDPSTWTPFITSQFLHGGFLHIASNMLFLWVFGDNVEKRLGFFTFPIFYLLAGVVGGLAQYILSTDSTIPMLGASGAIAGVLGAYLVLYPNHKIKTLVPTIGFISTAYVPASIMLVYWFITQLFSGTASIVSTESGGVAYFAHIGGFAFGWLIGKLAQQKPEQDYIMSQ